MESDFAKIDFNFHTVKNKRKNPHIQSFTITNHIIYYILNQKARTKFNIYFATNLYKI